jgi:hypothetical protein
MNVEIGAEAVLFPEKEFINGIAVAVHDVQILIFNFLKWFLRKSSAREESRKSGMNGYVKVRTEITLYSNKIFELEFVNWGSKLLPA